jgi:opacity protein-like surface antigen
MTLNKLLRTSAAALGALAVASVTPAAAADMYSAPAGGYKDVYVPAPVWAGFYIGAHMGIDWANVDLGTINFWDNWGNPWSDHRSFNTTGGFGGVQLGYNFQSGSCCFVYGLEVDLGGAAINGNPHEPYYPLGWASGKPLGVQFTTNGNNGGFYGDVDGRLGYTWGSTLLYVKGGFAWLTTDISRREGFYWGGGSWTYDNGNGNNNTLTGWNIGGGVEWKVSPSWSIKAEYLYFDFSNNNNNCCADNGWSSYRNGGDLTVNTVKIGFNYFWNAPPAPLK